MNKSMRWLVFTGAFLGMGFSMPSCPGQQAMQQQLDTLQASNTELNKKVQTLTTQLNALNTDMGQVKPLLKQMADVIQAQRGALELLDTSVKELQKPKAAVKKKK